MKGNYLISDVFLDANANLSIAKQPFNLYVYFQAVRAKQIWGYSVSRIAQGNLEKKSLYVQVICVLTLTSCSQS